MHARIAARRRSIEILKDDKVAADNLRLAALQSYNTYLTTGIPSFETLGDALQSALQELDRLSPSSEEGAELRRNLPALMMTLAEELRHLSVQIEMLKYKPLA